MHYRDSTRTTLRTAARLGFLFYATSGLFSVFWLVFALPHVTWERLSLFVTLLGPICASVAFRASGSESRRRTALTAAWLMWAAGLIWTIVAAALTYGSVSGGLGDATSWNNTISMIWPLSMVSFLQVSYRGSTLQLEENTAPYCRAWCRVAVVLFVAGAAANVLDGTLFVGQTVELLVLLAGGLGYGWMRRKRPLVGAADWRDVTVLVAAPVLPAIVFDLATSHSPDGVWFTVARWSVAALAASGFAAVAVAALHHRRTRIGSPR
jgi:hypothetical protein